MQRSWFERAATQLNQRPVAWSVVSATVVLSVLALLQARRLGNEDDLLAFLPRGNPEVEFFGQINREFGGLDLALVGVATPDAFEPGFLARLQGLTRDLRDLHGLSNVLSLTNVVDYVPDAQRGGVITKLLVDPLPRDRAEADALRATAMAREHVVGNLVAASGQAVLIYCTLAHGVDAKQVARDIQAAVRRALPHEQVYWGGGPFISTYIYTTTQEDLRRLTPWAVLAIMLILLASFRSLLGAALVLTATGLAILWTFGAMALLGERYNIILGALPVILFATGSAYGTHVLSRYWRHSQTLAPGEALRRTMTGLGPVVVASALTTVAGLASFFLMDIRPLRVFGVFAAFGILCSLLLSLTFVPAVITLSHLHRVLPASDWLRGLSAALAGWVAGRRRPVLLGLALCFALAVGAATRVDPTTDLTTFFAPGSPPDQADAFLAANFGGAAFVQVHVRGDLDEPAVLRELRGLADRARLLPHVAAVTHIGQLIALVNDALAGERRIPDTRAQVRTLYPFLQSDPAAAQVINADRSQSLLHIKLDTLKVTRQAEAVAAIERLVAEAGLARYAVIGVEDPRLSPRRAALVLARLQAHLADFGATPAVEPGRLEAAIAAAPDQAEPAAVAAALTRFLRSDESAVPLDRAPTGAGAAPRRAGGQAQPRCSGTLLLPACVPEPGAVAPALAAAIAALGPRPEDQQLRALAAAALGVAPAARSADDLAWSIASVLDETWERERAWRHARQLLATLALRPAKVDDQRQQRFQQGVALALRELSAPSVLLPLPPEVPAGEAGMVVGGSPPPGGERALRMASDPGMTASAGQLGLTVSGLPVMHRGLSDSVTANQLRSLAATLVLVLVLLAFYFGSLSGGLLAVAPTALTLALVYGAMGLLHVRLDIGTSMLAALVLGMGVDYAVHMTSAWYRAGDAPPASAARLAAQRTGAPIWTNAAMIVAGFAVLTLGDAKPLQNVGSLTALALALAALATFVAIPALARRALYHPTAAIALVPGELSANHALVPPAAAGEPGR